MLALAPLFWARTRAPLDADELAKERPGRVPD
jgi:hypothetical protein